MTVAVSIAVLSYNTHKLFVCQDMVWLVDSVIDFEPYHEGSKDNSTDDAASSCECDIGRWNSCR